MNGAAESFVDPYVLVLGCRVMKRSEKLSRNYPTKNKKGQWRGDARPLGNQHNENFSTENRLTGCRVIAFHLVVWIRWRNERRGYKKGL